MKRILFVATITALSLSLSACDSGGDGDDETPSEAGTYEATAEGSIDKVLSGDATSTGIAGVWTLLMTKSVNKNGPEDTITLTRLNARPGEGTYSVDNSGTTFVGTALIDGTSFVASSGNLVITSSSSSSVRGTFGMSMASGSQTLTLEGSFNATNIEFGGQ